MRPFAVKGHAQRSDHPDMSEPLAPGAQLRPGYRVVAHLSRNAALDVYDLFSVERDCRCIGKVVRGDRTDDRARVRLVREGEILLSLTHPHIVRAYALLDADADPALVLETLTGETVSHMLASDGPLGYADLAELGRQLCSALGYLHRRGWVHLDLKPDNVIAQGGIAKVLDLSLARPPGPVNPGIGTRGWLAPEQAAGAVAGPPADVWGAGAVLYAAATGGDRPDGPRRSLAALPRGLRGAITACLEHDPGLRPSVAELAAALAPFTGDLAAAA